MDVHTEVLALNYAGRYLMSAPGLFIATRMRYVAKQYGARPARTHTHMHMHPTPLQIRN